MWWLNGIEFQIGCLDVVFRGGIKPFKAHGLIFFAFFVNSKDNRGP